MASIDLTPGQQLRHVDGKVVTLARRKSPGDPNPSRLPFHPGWWLGDGSGLADFVIDADDGMWTVLGQERGAAEDDD